MCRPAAYRQLAHQPAFPPEIASARATVGVDQFQTVAVQHGVAHVPSRVSGEGHHVKAPGTSRASRTSLSGEDPLSRRPASAGGIGFGDPRYSGWR